MGSNASMGLRPMWTKEAATALFVGVFIVEQQSAGSKNRQIIYITIIKDSYTHYTCTS